MTGPVVSRSGAPAPPLPEEHDLWARHLVVCFLQGLFNKLPNEHNYHWEPDDQVSKIVVTAGTPIDYGRAGTRPLITVDVGQYQPANIALDQLRTSSPSTGERMHMDLVPGSLAVYVFSRVETEARRLGGWVMRQIRYHRRVLQKVGGFHQIGSQLSVAPPTAPGQLISGTPDPEAVMVTVHVPWHMQWGWYVKPVAPPQMTTTDYFTGERAQEYERPRLVQLRDIRSGFRVGDQTYQVGLRAGTEPLDD